MKEVIEILTIVFFILVILYIYYKILFRIVSFISNSTTVLIDFLEKENLMFEEVLRPKNNDKKKNPFKRDDNYFIEVLLPYSIINNRIVVASNKNGNLKYFWLQKKVFWFKKPEYKFKEIHLKEKEENNKKNKIIIVKDFCPACNSKLAPNEKSCRECGLNFM